MQGRRQEGVNMKRHIGTQVEVTLPQGVEIFNL